MAGVGQHGGALDVNAELAGAGKDGACQLRFQFFGTIAEICLGGAHMGGVDQGVLAAFG